MTTRTDASSLPTWLERMDPARREVVLEGRSRLDPRRIGAIVGIVGGLVFATDYRSFLPGAAQLVVVGLAVALAVATLAALFVRPRALGRPATLANRAWLVYLASVAGMLALIAVGRWLLASVGHEAAAPAVIVLAVGAHLLPFAAAFRERHFRDVGLALVVLGAVGLAVGILVGAPVGQATAVLAGLVMLALMVAYAVRGRALTQPAG